MTAGATPPDPQAPIGVFDSGVGGLSVLRAIRAALPHEALVYVADSGHAPYGDREPEFIEARAVAVAEFLVAQGAKALVVACNTATAVAVQRLRAALPVPIVAIEPAVKPAVAMSTAGIVGVLATSRTLASPAFARLCERHAGRARVLLQPCPGLAERVEAGDLDGPATRALLARYARPLVRQGADVLVLGCTHYPFLTPALRDLVGPAVRIVDPSDAVARELVRRLQGRLAAAPAAGGSVPAERFFTTGVVGEVGAVIGRLWGQPVRVHHLDGER